MPNKLPNSEYMLSKMASSPFPSSLKAYEYYITTASITRGMDSNTSLPSHVIIGWVLNFSEIKFSHL